MQKRICRGEPTVLKGIFNFKKCLQIQTNLDQILDPSEKTAGVFSLALQWWWGVHNDVGAVVLGVQRDRCWKSQKGWIMLDLSFGESAMMQLGDGRW